MPIDRVQRPRSNGNRGTNVAINPIAAVAPPKARKHVGSRRSGSFEASNRAVVTYMAEARPKAMARE